MAHDWIKGLADRIKEIDHDAAREPLNGDYAANLVRTKGLVFFNDTVKSLERAITRLRGELRGDVTEGSIDLKQHQREAVVQISRPAFPFFSAQLSFEPENHRIKFLYSKANPAINFPQEQVPEKDGSFLFLIGCYDMLYVTEAYGSKKLHTPDELARHIIETLFSV